jgi:hypothetical protein
MIVVMDPDSAAGSILAAIGLSGAAGLNAWIPLFTSGLLARAGVIELAAPYDRLGSTWVLVITGSALLIDLVGDKIPGIDHLLHVIGVALHPVAGALLFAGQAGVGSDLPTVLSLLGGAALAGGLHGLRATARPAVTAGTAGSGNALVSAGEDVLSAVLTVLALALPVLAVALLIAVAVSAIRMWRRRSRRSRRA